MHAGQVVCLISPSAPVHVSQTLSVTHESRVKEILDIQVQFIDAWHQHFDAWHQHFDAVRQSWKLYKSIYLVYIMWWMFKHERHKGGIFTATYFNQWFNNIQQTLLKFDHLNVMINSKIVTVYWNWKKLYLYLLKIYKTFLILFVIFIKC